MFTPRLSIAAMLAGVRPRPIVVNPNARSKNPPPPVRDELQQPRISDEVFWSPGYWAHSQGMFFWMGGHWELSRPDLTYVAAGWEEVDGGWSFRAARWLALDAIPGRLASAGLPPGKKISKPGVTGNR
jgi:hypothetical protein